MNPDEIAERRILQVRKHLASVPQIPQSVQAAPCAVNRSLPRFDATFMEHYLETDRGLKEEVYDLFKQHPELLYAVEEGMTKEQHREFVRKQLLTILASGYSPMSFFMKDYKKYFYMAELLALVDLSLTVKMGVQYSLWGGSVMNLGTERHKKQYFDAIDKFQIPGCFCMTELGHGSNVAALQTECVLDTTTDEWVVNTPDDSAIKWCAALAGHDSIGSLPVHNPEERSGLD